MGHTHNHTDPGHDHSFHPEQVNRAFIGGIVLNILFVTLEVFSGLYSHSLSLLSDAAHNLADVGTLIFSLIAFRLLKVRSNKKFTYGYRKTSILITLLNAMVLLISIGAITYESVLRLIHPEPVPGKVIMIVAAAGMVINAFSAYLFFGNREKDLNIKGAYLHLLSDALVSAVVVVGGIVIYYTGWYEADALLSLLVAGVILVNTWNLLKTSLRLSLDGVPAGIDMEELKQRALSIPGIKEIHHIHVWGISTNENALTAHLVLPDQITFKEEQKVKHDLKHLFQHMNIHHSTLETERENTPCKSEDC